VLNLKFPERLISLESSGLDISVEMLACVNLCILRINYQSDLDSIGEAVL